MCEAEGEGTCDLDLVCLQDNADSGYHVPSQSSRPWLDIVIYIHNPSTGKQDPEFKASADYIL